MALYIGITKRDQDAFRARAHRGSLRKLYRSIYTDDFERAAEDIVAENALAIAGALFPERHRPGRGGRHGDHPQVVGQAGG
jgi:hypothetical protein